MDGKFMSVNEHDFKQAMRLWGSGISVVAAKANDNAVRGMTVTSFTSVSVEPPQILVCLNQSADTLDAINESQAFSVNILSAGQQEISNQFAGGASQEERFSHRQWHEGETGSPILDDTLASIECTVSQKILASTHWIIIGEVKSIDCRTGKPLMYYDSSYRLLTE